METNARIKHDSILHQKATALFQAAHEYWEEYQKVIGPDAIVWVENDNGHFVLFTRSEYKNAIMASATRETKTEPIMFDPFVK